MKWRARLAAFGLGVLVLSCGNDRHVSTGGAVGDPHSAASAAPTTSPPSTVQVTTTVGEQGVTALAGAACSSGHDRGVEASADGIWFDVDVARQVLTACDGEVPVASTMWCCGMGELVLTFDSNGDGVTEVVVGGTSVGGGGGGMYSLVDGVLAPIATDDGREMYLLTGDTGESIAQFGCVDDQFVQVEVSADGTAGWARRTFYRFEGHRAVVVDEQRQEWSLTEPVVSGGSMWRVYEGAPQEVVNDLFECDQPTTFELAGGSGLVLGLGPRPLTNVTCEAQWPRPYRPIVVVAPDGEARTWELPSEQLGLLHIDESDFVSTPDGRFGLLETFTCSHEGTVKTMFAGRFVPETGELLEWREVAAPDEYVSEHPYLRRHPDRLVIRDNGDIVGELESAVGVLEVVLSDGP